MDNPISKEKLIEIIKSLKVNYNEGIQNDNSHVNPRIVFWDYVWEGISASGNSYEQVVTYQISFFNNCVPRESKELKIFLRELADLGINPMINHEYIEKSKEWHSFFSIDIVENVF